MGACSSCLAQCLGRRKEDPDQQRLLSPEYPHGNHGTFDPQRMGGGQSTGRGGEAIDPQDQVREREALERIVTTASMNLIDIFALTPHPPPTNDNPTRRSSSVPLDSEDHHHHSNKASSGGGGSGMLEADPSSNVAQHQRNFNVPNLLDTKRMAIYRALLQRTSPPQPPVMPEVLSANAVSEEERAFLEEIGKRADEAVGVLTKVKGVGKVVVGLDSMEL